MAFGLYLASVVMTFLRPLELLAPDLAFLRPMLILSVLVFATSLASLIRTKASAATRQHYRMIIAFIVIVGLSVAYKGTGFILPTMIDYSPSPILYLTTVMNVTNIERLKTAGRVMVICVVCLAFLSIYSYFTGFMVDLLFYKEGLESYVKTNGGTGWGSDVPFLDRSGGHLWRMRSFGFLNDPNDFAQMLVCTLPFLMVFHRPGRRLRNLFFIWVPVAAMLFCIYSSHSRGALLGLASLFFFVVKERLGATRTMVLMVVGMVMAMALNFTGGRAYTADEGSAGGRIDAWARGLDMLTAHPLLGVGYGHFTEFNSHTAHNSFVLCFAELGLVGYFVWLGMLVVGFKQLNVALNLTEKTSAEHRWALAVRASLIGFLTCAFFLSRTYHPPLYIILAFSAAVWMSAVHTIKDASARQAALAPFLWRSFTVKLVVVSVIVFKCIVTYKMMTVGEST
jgi:hypothetical protein